MEESGRLEENKRYRLAKRLPWEESHTPMQKNHENYENVQRHHGDVVVIQSLQMFFGSYHAIMIELSDWDDYIPDKVSLGAAFWKNM